MSTLLDDIAAATKGKSFKTYKYGFDGIDVPRFDYDDHRHQITWKSYGETAYLPKPKMTGLFFLCPLDWVRATGPNRAFSSMGFLVSTFS